MTEPGVTSAESARGSAVCYASQSRSVFVMNNMNPYQGYEYVFQMNGSPYPVKMEEPYCDGDPERDDPPPPQGHLPYMSTFAKHGAPSVAMLYPQLTYDLHPLLLNQRRRSSQSEKYPDSLDPLEETSSLNPTLSSIHLKDSARYKPKLKMPVKRRIHEQEEPYGMPERPPVMEEPSSEYSAKIRKSFFCSSCGKTFKFQTSLLRHNNKVHISKYQCPTCARVFSRQAYLDVHTSKQGSSCYLGESPYYY